jgi:hypothetical protein
MSLDRRDEVIRECELDIQSGNWISLDDYVREQERARRVDERRDERERMEREERRRRSRDQRGGR